VRAYQAVQAKGESMKWFGVKCLFRTTIKHRSTGPDVDACEERILLVAATDFDDALRIGEREARSYAASNQWVNIHGKRVVTRCIGAFDAFRMSRGPASGAEIYSQLFLVPRETTNSALANRFLGSRQEQPGVGSRAFLPDFALLNPSAKASARPSLARAAAAGRKER
jgi:hypothetical protein